LFRTIPTPCTTARKSAASSVCREVLVKVLNRDATRRIAHGSTVQVDGTTGIVTILKRS
jgi:hypothetical protein